MSAEITPEMIARVRSSGLRCIAGVYVPAILDALESSRAEVQRLTEEARLVPAPPQPSADVVVSREEWGVIEEILKVSEICANEGGTDRRCCMQTDDHHIPLTRLRGLRSSTNHDAQDAGEERGQLRADRDRLASELHETRAELERVRLANRVLDSAAKDAQAWAYQLQECRAELARVRRNHLRRMGSAAVMRSWQQVDPGRADALIVFAGQCFRAALASMETRV